MNIKLIEINDSNSELEVCLLGWKMAEHKFLGWTLIIYFPRDGSPIYFRGRLAKWII